MTFRHSVRLFTIGTTVIGFLTAIVLHDEACVRLRQARQGSGAEPPVISFGRKLKATADSDISARQFADPRRPDERKSFVDVNSTGTGLVIQAGVEAHLLPHHRETARLSDYPPGVFRLDSAPAAYELVGDLTEAILRTQALLPSGSHVHVTVRGTADALPVRAGRVYPEGYDAIQAYPYFSLNRGQPSQMTLVPGRTALTNENLAFKRAHEVVKVLRLVGALRAAEIDIETEEVPGIGGQYRSVLITVEIKSSPDESASVPHRLTGRSDIPRS